MVEHFLHVGVDARVLAEWQTGVATYTRLLIRHLLATREESRFTLFTHRPIPASVLGEIGGSDRVSTCSLRCPSPMLIRPVWDHVLVPATARWRDLDLFFSPLSVVPRFLGVPTVVTIHDLGFLRLPEIQPWKYRLYWRRALHRAARKADRIIAVSRSTADDAVRLLPVDPERIEVVPESIDPFFLEEPTQEEERKVLVSLGLEPGYLLTVGTLEPRKNYSITLDVFSRLQNRKPGLRLVIVGAPGWLCEGIIRAIRSNPGRVRWFNRADNATLRALYRRAGVFLFPSLYEGFGLPVLEAMACGTPVVTSNAGSLPEVAGDAAICISPCDARGLAAAVWELLENARLREEYRARGRRHVRRYSWQEVAWKTWEVLERAKK